MKLENNLVQSRDEDDGNVTEEDLTFSVIIMKEVVFQLIQKLVIKKNIQ